MRPDTLRRVRIATDIVDNPEHPAWKTIRQRVEADLQDPPLIVLGQGTSKRVYTGDDLGGTGFFPLRETARRFGGALLSFIGVRRCRHG